ncbi:GNAT family N-acetyltransferase [Salinibaculum salinum]|uniref:GNAT family N-acetyltransferase n=1 Tax=Salinibaculum salinum TaxID=3131996 RepID=UPI0030EB8D25
MKATERPTFDTSDRRRIYEYIERNGAVRPEALYDDRIVRVEPERFRQLVAIMKRDGVIEERNGTLRVALEGGAREEYRTANFDFEIRPARQEDFSGILGVIEQVASQRTYIEAETVAEQLNHEDALIRHNDLDTRMFFVATVSEEVVGWCHVESPELEKLRHTAKLTIGILEEYQGEGLGSHLLQRGLSWARSNGYEKVYQSVPATNERAIGFLRDHGWEEEARRTDHYKLDDEYVDEVMLAHHLDE